MVSARAMLHTASAPYRIHRQAALRLCQRRRSMKSTSTDGTLRPSSPRRRSISCARACDKSSARSVSVNMITRSGSQCWPVNSSSMAVVGVSLRERRAEPVEGQSRIRNSPIRPEPTQTGLGFGLAFSHEGPAFRVDPRRSNVTTKRLRWYPGDQRDRKRLTPAVWFPRWGRTDICSPDAPPSSVCEAIVCEKPWP